jgi:hypothetical protein
VVETLWFECRGPPPKQKALRPISAPGEEIERRARFSYDDLLALFNCSERSNPRSATVQPYNSAAVPPANSDPASRCRKNPSSYPDFRTRPFCTTTLILPLKFKVLSRLSIEAESASEALTFRRNSMKFFPSFELSNPLIVRSLPINQSEL